MKFIEIKKTIIELAEKHDASSSEFMHDYHENDEFFDGVTKTCGKFKYIETATRDPESNGSFELQRTVIYFTDHDIYIALDGTYNSWESQTDDFDQMFEVQKVVRIIEYFEAKPIKK